MSEGVIIGIDGGGSKTLIAAARRDGTLVDIRRGAATSPLESAGWSETLSRQVQPFLNAAPILGVAAGLPAHGEVEEVSEAQRQVIAKLFGPVPQRVLNDVDAAHIGGFAGGPGILILAGTGSMAWARDEAGQSHRTGGWGEIIGDEGSGHWIGKRVLEAVSKSMDGRAAPTTLAKGVFDQLGLDPAQPVNALEGWVSRFANPRTQIASLAPIAFAQAEAGDRTAEDLIEAAADELALHVTTLQRRLGIHALRWSYAGGLFSSPRLRSAVTRRLRHPPEAPRLPPIGGALLAAAQQLGWPIDDAWLHRLAASLDTVPARTHQA